MNKTTIKSFAITARKKLISEITYRAGLVGVTKNGMAHPIHKADGIEMYDIGASDPYTIKGEQLKQRKSLVSRVKEKGFDNVIEEVAYTWFNRIIAVRFMEVNDYLPTRVRVLSSETKEKVEPDIVTEAPNIDLGFNSVEVDEILQLKHDNKLDELFRMLFIKQCNALNVILPELFEKTSDFTELLLTISFTNEDSIVRLLVDSVEEDDFNINKNGQVEIIGWMYQFYNTELKDDTFTKLKANVKITKERMPAATQLFTPDWIVRYMVENSLGRLWLENSQTTMACGNTNDALREIWQYYVEEADQDDEVKLQLLKLTTENPVNDPTQIKLIDPCMGSGHVLVYAFDVLIAIYLSCGYTERDAAKLIIEKNLHGFDIDYRAYQLAYFAIMMKARSYNRRILNENISHNLSLSYAFDKTKYAVEVASYIIDKTQLSMNNAELKQDIAYLLDMNEDVSEYGSLVDVRQLDFDKIQTAMEKLTNESIIGDFKNILPLLKQAKIFSQQYDVVITNPPYMGSKGMSTKLSAYVQKNYPDSKSDLFAVFIERCGQMVKSSGLQAMITQHAWMFLSSYENLRAKLMLKDIINMAHLGARAFEEIGGEVVQTTAFVLRNSNVKKYKATYSRLIEYDNQQLKELGFLNGENKYIAQKEHFSKIPGMPIAYWVSDNAIVNFKNGTCIETISETRIGMATANNDLFMRFWFEINNHNLNIITESREEAINSGCKWFAYCKGGTYRKWYGNLEYVVNWENDGFEIRNFRDEKTGKVRSHNYNLEYIFKTGLTYTAISSSKFACRIMDKSLFGSGGSGICNISTENKLPLLAFLNSKVAEYLLNILSATMNFEVNIVGKIPFILGGRNEEISDIVRLIIDVSKTDWDSFETSWHFKRHSLVEASSFYDNKTKNEYLKDAFYIWKRWTDGQFYKLQQNEEELNRIFIEIYGLQDELTPEVADEDVTIRKADLERDIKSFISYAVGCMFGRYSLDVEGLAYAGGDWDCNKYKTFIPDDDNIIPITDTEYFPDDIVGRFVEFVKLTFGADTLEENLDFIANALGIKGNTSREIIRQYFIKDFYKDHVKIYQKKPIYWLFDSGKENGFKALIYMHRYNQDTVSRVRADYLHKTQKAIESAISRADMVIESTANPSQKAKAVKGKEKLVKQLAETRVYDAAIGHIATQRIAIDLDDGVTVNYAKFQGVEVSSEGKKSSMIDLLGKI